MRITIRNSGTKRSPGGMGSGDSRRARTGGFSVGPFSQARRQGFTLVELLACTGIASLLIALLMPVLGSSRETARRVECDSNLQQLGLALRSYHDVTGTLPPAWQWDAEEQTAFGWLPPLLPSLQQSVLLNSIDFTASLSSSPNEKIREQTIPLFVCPSDLRDRSFLLFEKTRESAPSAKTALFRLPAASYVGVTGIGEPGLNSRAEQNRGAFAGAIPVRFEDFSRGLSETVIVGERHATTLPSTWVGTDRRGEAAFSRILGSAEFAPNAEAPSAFSSRHPGCSNFLWADGHVAAVSEAIDPEIYHRLALPLLRREF